MSKMPMQPWFPDSNIADTAMLTLEEQGAYRLLLDHLWIKGGYLKDDDKDTARLLRITTRKWRTLKPRLVPYLCFVDGRITQKRLLLDYNKACEISRKNAENGRKGGLKSAENLKTTQAIAGANGIARKPNGAGPKHISESLDHLLL